MELNDESSISAITKNNKTMVNIINIILKHIIQNYEFNPNKEEIEKYSISQSLLNEVDDFNTFIENTHDIPTPTEQPVFYNNKQKSTPNLNKALLNNKNNKQIKPEKNSNNNSNNNYIIQLEKKIRTQANRLKNLENYKFLCEQKIKILNPTQQFPITPENLNSNNFNLNEYDFESLKNIIENYLIKNNLLSQYITVDGVLNLAKAIKEMEEYKKQLILSQTMVNSLKNDFEELTKENTTNLNNQEINDKLETYKNNLENLKNDYDKLINENNDLKKQNIKLMQNTELKNEINEYQLKNEKLKLDINNILNEKNNLEKENVDLKQQLKNINMEKIRNQLEYEQMQKELNNEKEKYINDLKNKNEELNEYKKKIDILEKKDESIEEEQEQIGINEKQINFDEINSIMEENRNLREELEEKENIIQNYNIQKEEYENQIGEKLKYVDDYITNNKQSIIKFLNKLKVIISNTLKEKNFKNNQKFIENLNNLTKKINNITNDIENYSLQLNDDLFYDILELLLNTYSNEINVSLVANLDLYSKLNILQKDRNDLYSEYTESKSDTYLLNKENSKLKTTLQEISEKYKDILIRFKKNEKTNEMLNQTKKNFSNLIIKFIKNIPNKELVKVIHDIINASEQIDNYELNKNIIEDKLITSKCNYDKSIKDKSLESNSDFGKFVKEEHENLKKLIIDYKNKINSKKEDLNKLYKSYNELESLYIQKYNDEKNKFKDLFEENKLLQKKIGEIDKENKILREINDKNNRNLNINEGAEYFEREYGEGGYKADKKYIETNAENIFKIDNISNINNNTQNKSYLSNL